MVATHVIHRYAVDCAWITVSFNLNKRICRMCLCDNKETEEHLLLNCSLHSALRVDLMQSVKSILVKGL